MTRRWTKALGAALLLTLVGTAAACGGDSDKGATDDGRTSVVIAETLEPPTLDISTGSGAAIPQALLYNVYETLVKIDDKGDFEPLLAEEYEVSDDGLTYTFRLQDGVTFHGGQPMAAKDAKFVFDRNMTNEAAPPIVKGTFANVASIETPDDATVVITLKQRSRDFLFNLAQTGGAVYAEATVADLATNPNGTGPYQFDTFVTGDRLVLKRFDAYWSDEAPLEQVTFRYIPDPNAQANALKAGDVDIIDNLTPELFEQFMSDTANYETVEGSTNGETILAFNNKQEPLDDPRVRQAITLAIDKQDIVAAASSGLGKVIGSHASVSDPWYVDLADTYAHDVEKAQALLDEAGVTDLTLTLKVPPVPYAKSSSQVVASSLEKVGITVKLEDVEFPLWIDEVFTKKNYDMTIISHVEARDINLYANPDYYWQYDDAETQQLLKDADAAATEKESDEIYEKVQRRINEQAANNWMYLLPRLQVVRKGITGYPTGSYSLSYDVTGIR